MAQLGILLDFNYQPIISWIHGYRLRPLTRPLFLLGLLTGEHLDAYAERTPSKADIVHALPGSMDSNLKLRTPTCQTSEFTKMTDTISLIDYPPRDLAGYGRFPPNPNWPNGAKIAVNFVINYEEGGENSLDNGDAQAESNLQETGPKPPLVGERDLPMESQFEYGSRRGMWRLLNLFEKHNMHITIYAVGKAYEAQPEIAKACEEAGHETASHCYRWINYTHMDAEAEEKLIRQAINSFQKTSPSGKVPVGWYYGRPSPRSRALVCKVYKELGLELLYQSDTYADDLPYWIPDPISGPEKGLLLVPYTYDTNDFKFYIAPGFASSMAYYEHAKNAFDTLYEEGQNGQPSFMTVALHARMLGRPGRFPAIKQFVEYIKTKPNVWVATREEIARHWMSQYPYKPPLM